MALRRRLALPLVVIGAGLAFAISRAAPQKQVVHVVLGDAAAKVEEVRLRYAARARATGQDGFPWEREVTFHYAGGHAPRIVSHEPALVRGDYEVEVEVGMERGRTVTETRTVAIEGGVASVDVSEKLLLATHDVRGGAGP